MDLESYERLLDPYLGLGIGGIFPLVDDRREPNAGRCRERGYYRVHPRHGRRPGTGFCRGGNATAKVVERVRRLDRYDFPGIVSVCPYYNRPGQDGLAAHFRQIAAATERQIVIYNIPYRTAVNLANDTLLALAEQANIVGVKDSTNACQ